MEKIQVIEDLIRLAAKVKDEELREEITLKLGVLYIDTKKNEDIEHFDALLETLDVACLIMLNNFKNNADEFIATTPNAMKELKR